MTEREIRRNRNENMKKKKPEKKKERKEARERGGEGGRVEGSRVCVLVDYRPWKEARERGREGGREGRREGGRKGGREGGWKEVGFVYWLTTALARKQGKERGREGGRGRVKGSRVCLLVAYRPSKEARKQG